MMTQEPAPGEGKPGTSGRAKRWTMKEGGWDLSTWQGGIDIFEEKGQRVRQPKKGLWKVSLEAWKREIKVSLIRTPQKGKLVGKFLEGNLKRRI